MDASMPSMSYDEWMGEDSSSLNKTMSRDTSNFSEKLYTVETKYGTVPCLLEVRKDEVKCIQETYAANKVFDSDIKAEWYKKGAGETATLTFLDKEGCVYVDNGESVIRELISKSVTGYGNNGYINSVASLYKNKVLTENPLPLEFDSSMIYFKNGHCDSNKRCFVEKSVYDVTMLRSQLSYKSGLWSEKYWNMLSNHCTLPEHFLAFMGLCYFPHLPFKKGLMNVGLLGNETKSTQCGVLNRINDSIYSDLFINKKSSQVFNDEKGYNDGDIGKANLLIRPPRDLVPVFKVNYAAN
jgi:hypothetical protein